MIGRDSFRQGLPARRAAGFTLIELMVTVAVVAIVLGVAGPSYSGYMARSRVPAGLEALSAYALRMEQAFQDNGHYGRGSCALSAPVPTHFDFSCSVGRDGQSFTATVTGKGTLAGYAYAIDQAGTRTTVSHPKGVPSAPCWSSKGQTCDE